MTSLSVDGRRMSFSCTTSFPLSRAEKHVTTDGFTFVVYDVINSNTSEDGASENETYKEQVIPVNFRYVATVFLLISFVFGLLGNALVIYVITRFDDVRTRSVSNYYIWNLALADILLILTLPFFCFSTYTGDWVFGDVACRLANVFRECNKFASVFTLMALSVDRFLATFHDLNRTVVLCTDCNALRYRQLPLGVSVCALIWTVSLLSSSPYGVFSHAHRSAGPHGDRHSCRVRWPIAHSLLFRKIWISIQMVVGFAVPLFVIAIFNVLLLRRVYSLVRVPDTGSTTTTTTTCLGSDLFARRSRMNWTMTRTVFAVVVIFVVCQVPYHVTEFVSLCIAERALAGGNGAYPGAEKRRVFLYFNILSQTLVFVSSCCNPIIYGIFNRNYRSRYRLVLCCSIKEKRRLSCTNEVQMTTVYLR